jgi:hypothetical protein
VWLAGLTLILVIGVAWLVTLGFAIYEFRFYRGKSLIDFFGGYAAIHLVLGVVFVVTVNKFYDWWADQHLKSFLKGIEVATPTPLQRLNDILKEYEPWAAANLSETLKHQLAASPSFQATAAEAEKLALEAIAFQDSPYTLAERAAFQKVWQAKIEKFTERIAQDDPLVAVEVILKAIEKESQTR